MHEEHQWENEGGKVKPEPVEDSELGGEGCNDVCSNTNCARCFDLFGPVIVPD